MSLRAVVRTVVVLLAAATGSPCAVAADAADTGHGKTPIHRATVDNSASGHAQPAGSAGTTLILLGLLLAGAIIGRRLVQHRVANRTGRTAPEPVRLVCRQQIDPELSIRLLLIGPRLLVVAATPQGIATLSEITDPEEIALLTGETAATSQHAPPFTGDRPIIGGSDLVTPAHRASPSPAGDECWSSRVSPPLQTGG